MCTKPIGRSFESIIFISLTEIIFPKSGAGSYQAKMLHSLFLESSWLFNLVINNPYAEHLERADYKLIWTVSWVYCDNVILLTSSRHSRQCCVTHLITVWQYIFYSSVSRCSMMELSLVSRIVWRSRHGSVMTDKNKSGDDLLEFPGSNQTIKLTISNQELF